MQRGDVTTARLSFHVGCSAYLEVREMCTNQVVWLVSRDFFAVVVCWRSQHFSAHALSIIRNNSWRNKIEETDSLLFALTSGCILVFIVKYLLEIQLLQHIPSI